MPPRRNRNENPRRKAAILLASLERDQAATILRALPSDTVQKVTAEIRKLGEVEREEQEEVFREFSTMLAKGTLVRGGESVARGLLQEVVGHNKVDELLDDRPQAFSSIAMVDSEHLAGILSSELPSVAALILAFMPPRKSAQILSFLEPDLREVIITRLAQKRNADPQIIERIEKIVVDKVVSVIHHPAGDQKDDALGGAAFVAEMFQFVERQLEEEMLGAIEESSPDTAEEIRDMLFTFDDIAKLSDEAVQKILRQVAIDKLVIALRGAAPTIREKITRNMSRRANETLQEEDELLGKVRLKDVEQEQRDIVAVIRGLEAAGEVNLREAEQGEDVYV
jgi:flagellar motor switch protein FliG